MLDDRISAQQNLDAFRQMRQELLLQIKQSLETIEDSQELLRRVNAQIEGAQIARTDVERQSSLNSFTLRDSDDYE